MDIIDYFGVKYDSSITKKDDLLSIKYQPKTSQEFIENIKEKQQIKKWLVETPKLKNALILSGPTGCGKTLLIKLLCSETGYRTLYFDASVKRTKKDVEDVYSKNMKATNKIFIMDELESASTSDMGISNYSKWIDVKKRKSAIPFVFIINSTYISKLNDLKQHCIQFELKYPSTKNIFSKCINICEDEEIDIDLPNLKKYIAFHENDYRTILNGLKCIEITTKKDADLSMYGIYNFIANDNLLDDKLRYFCCEKGTIPIIVQENYIDWNLSNKDNLNVCETMSEADVYHQNSFYSSNNYNISSDVYGVLSSIKPLNISIDNNVKHTNVKFGTIWTKQSSLYQKRKYIKEAQNSLDIYNIQSLTFIRSLIFFYVNNNDYSALKPVIRYYKLSLSDIENIIRMFSFTDDKISINMVKKQLSKLYSSL